MVAPGWGPDVHATTLSFGPYLDASGQVAFVGMRGTITPSARLVETSTGAVIAVPAQVVIGPAGTASVVLPFTDQTSLNPIGFTYDVTWAAGGYRPSPGDATISLPAVAGPTVDFDTLTPAASTPGVSFPVADAMTLLGMELADVTARLVALEAGIDGGVITQTSTPPVSTAGATDNGDGTVALPSATDNGDGTLTIAGAVDHGDGTYTI